MTRAALTGSALRVLPLVVLTIGLASLAYALREAILPRPEGFWGVDFHDYWIAAGRVLRGEIPYAPEMLSGPFAADGMDRYRYPPPFALLIAPLAALPSDTATWVWLIISSSALLAGCLLAARAGGVRLTVRNVLWIAALLCLARPVHDLLLVGNVGGVEALLIGIAISARPPVAAAATGLLGVLKIAPAAAWLATIARDWRAAVKGFLIVAAGIVLTLPVLWEAWLAFPVVLVNQISGGGANDPGNLGMAQIVSELLPGQPMASTLSQLVMWAVAAALIVLSITWASRPGGWVGGLLVATAAGLLVPATMWFHYLALFAPFIAYGWPRLGTASRVGFVALGVGMRLGPAPLRLAEVGLMVIVLAYLAWQLRPTSAWVPTRDREATRSR